MLYLIDLSSGDPKSIQNVLWSFQSSGCGLRRLFQLDVSLSLHLGPLSRSSLREYQIPPKVSPLTFGALEACSIQNSIKKSIDFGPPELWRLLGALEAPQLIFVKHCNKKSIYLGRPELWELQSSFLLRIVLRKASISDVQSSGGFWAPWKPHSSFLLRIALRKASIWDVQSSGSSKVRFY